MLRHLPRVELALLSCVHKAFHVAWRSLREQQPGKRYAPPSAEDIKWITPRRRLERAAYLGNVAVIRSMVAAGVDERGVPLLEAHDKVNYFRIVDQALWRATEGEQVQAVELLLGSGSDVRAHEDAALRRASKKGDTDTVQLLLQHGANVHARGDWAL